MKVKIGDTIYDPNKQPIMIVFEGDEKKLISKMSRHANKFCTAPQSMKPEDIRKFMILPSEKQEAKSSNEESSEGGD